MMKEFFKLTLLSVLIIGQALSQAKLSIGDNKPMDFGDVNSGAKLNHVVTLKNIGNDTLRIGNVKAQCGCTATVLKSSTVPPHDSTTLNVTFNSGGYPPGKVTKHVYITSNDTAMNGTYTMEFLASVITPLMVDPQFFSFPSAKVDSTYKKTLTLTNKSKLPVSIDSISGATEQITFTLGKMKLMPGEQTSIDAVLHPVKSGSFQGSLTLFTTVPDQPKLDIRYLAWINRK
ncbi:MAG: DUF1573 domain-containing protein [Bacteroidota bacterium]